MYAVHNTREMGADLDVQDLVSLISSSKSGTCAWRLLQCSIRFNSRGFFFFLFFFPFSSSFSQLSFIPPFVVLMFSSSERQRERWASVFT